MLIFLLQSIWLYIKELAGKDLEIDVILKFLLYVSPRLIVLVLPLTILLSSIMVFGNFAEKYEFAAMKSTGISLQRAMRSLSYFIVILSVITFFFANNIIPKAEFNFYNLRKNIAKVKPAFAIAVGQFNQLGDMNIKVGDKTGERGEFLDDVIIHQKKPRSSGNHTVIIADRGELLSSEDSDILQMVLFDGHYYDEIIPKDIKDRQRLPHIKSYFEKYTINIDLSYLEVDFEEQNITNRYSMLGVKDLSYSIDSLVLDKQNDLALLAKNMYNRSSAPTLKNDIITAGAKEKYSDSTFLDIFPDKLKVQLIDNALNNIKATRSIIRTKKTSFAIKEKIINKHIISLYEKFALGIACIILFFIGAPLGAIIKKGGFGLPIVIAIVLFLAYHFIGIFAKNSAEDSSLPPIFATWLSTIIMLPLSIYLTNSATKDRALVSLDGILIPFKKLLVPKSKLEALDKELSVTSEAYQKLDNTANKDLINVVKNYRSYNYTYAYRNTALKILNKRGITEEELRFGGNLSNENYEEALRYKLSFYENARVTYVLYFFAIFLAIGGAVLNNNGFPTLGKVLLGVGILFTIIYIVAFGKALNSQSKFYKVLDTNIISSGIVLIILGFPLFFIYYHYFIKRMDNDIKQII